MSCDAWRARNRLLYILSTLKAGLQVASLTAHNILSYNSNQQEGTEVKMGRKKVVSRFLVTPMEPIKGVRNSSGLAILDMTLVLR
jgi:hypothetical protein